MDRKIGTSGNIPIAPVEKPVEKPKFNPWSPFTYKITPNISYGELTLNQEARRFTKQYQCDTALELCKFLEKLRAAFGSNKSFKFLLINFLPLSPPNWSGNPSVNV